MTGRRFSSSACSTEYLIRRAGPTLFLNTVIDCNIEDPKGKSVDKVREIMDEIERRVKELVSGLKASQEINI